MLIKQATKIKSSEITPLNHYLDRRQFMIAAGMTAAALAIPLPRRASAALDYSALAKSEFSADEELTDYDDVTSYNNFYEFGVGKEDPAHNAGSLKPQPWTITVEGECDKPGRYDFDAVIKPHQLEERIYRLRCVEAWSMVIPWVGVPMGEVLKTFAPNSRAKFVEFHTLYDAEQMPGQRRPILDWPYREGLRIDEAMNPLAIFAVGLYGKTMPNQNGAPIRMIVPWKYGFKSIKSIVKIIFREDQPINTWQQQSSAEYGFYANVNPDVSHPRWSQAKERRIGEFFRRPTLPFNGYGEQVAGLYTGMNPKALY